MFKCPFSNSNAHLATAECLWVGPRKLVFIHIFFFSFLRNLWAVWISFVLCIFPILSLIYNRVLFGYISCSMWVLCHPYDISFSALCFSYLPNDFFGRQNGEWWLKTSRQTELLSRQWRPGDRICRGLSYSLCQVNHVYSYDVKSQAIVLSF